MASIPAVKLADLRRGDPRTITVNVLDGAGDPVPLDAGTWAASMRAQPSSTTAVDLTVDTSEAAAGVLVLSLTGAQTRTLPPQIVGDLEGTAFGTILTFTGNVKADVTRGASEPGGGLVDVVTLVYDGTGIELSETVRAVLVRSESGPGGGAVSSVNSKTGAVVLTAADVGAETPTGAQTKANAAQAAAEATAATGLSLEASARVAADTALDGRLDVVETTLPTKADLVDGVVPDGQLPAGITRDVEMAAYVDAALDALLDGAPGALDTLNELAAAIGDDANFAATVTAALAGKQAAAAELTVLSGLSSTALGRTLLTIASAVAARTALGVYSTTEVDAAIASGTSSAVNDGDPAGGVLSGTYPNPGFAADMATQAELDAAIATRQLLDADLTEIAALTTTTFGRSLLTQADAAAARQTIGAGRVAASVHTPATAGPSSTAETTLATLALPPDLAAGDRLLINIVADYLNASGGNVSYTPRFKLGATTVGGGQAALIANNASRRYFYATAEVVILSTTAEKFGGYCFFMGGAVAWDANPPGSLAMYGAATEDLATSPALTFTMQLSVSHASAEFALHGASLVVVKA